MRTSSTSQSLNFLPWFVSVVYIQVHNKWLPGMRMYTLVRGWAASKFVVRGGDRRKSFDSDSSRHMYNNKICTDLFFFSPAKWMKSKPSCCTQANSPGNDDFGAKQCGLEMGKTVTCLHLKCTIREINKMLSARPPPDPESAHDLCIQFQYSQIKATLPCSLSFKMLDPVGETCIQETLHLLALETQT